MEEATRPWLHRGRLSIGIGPASASTGNGAPGPSTWSQETYQHRDSRLGFPHGHGESYLGSATHSWSHRRHGLLYSANPHLRGSVLLLYRRSRPPQDSPLPRYPTSHGLVDRAVDTGAQIPAIRPGREVWQLMWSRRRRRW